MMNLAEIQKEIRYEPSSGRFYRIKSKPGVTAGQMAGTAANTGYRFLRLHGKRIAEHRLAWLFSKGDWPTSSIDHINGDTLDNRIENLRLASHAENMCNTAKRRDNASPFKSVSYLGRLKKWTARIQHNGKRHWLGYFETAEEAQAAYQEAAQRLFGEFARLEVSASDITAPMNRWYSAESAPRNNLPFLAIGRHSQCSGDPLVPLVVSGTMDGYVFRGYHLAIKPWTPIHFTHWMPLPRPPRDPS